ncbi:hypothetical protein TYRP_011311 [Tyrophagus putrescentiae]|nr:hypothetical protein TYRP_011311 [Tyrophagus putrescentiae]
MAIVKEHSVAGVVSRRLAGNLYNERCPLLPWRHYQEAMTKSSAEWQHPWMDAPMNAEMG